MIRIRISKIYKTTEQMEITENTGFPNDCILLKFVKIPAAVCILLVISVFLVLPGVNAADSVIAPGGTADSEAAMLEALGGEDAGWIGDNGGIFLRSDVTLTAPVTVTGGEITLNGAGCVIGRGFSDGPMIVINDGTLILGNIKNTDLEGTLIIDGGSTAGAHALVQRGGSVHFCSGTSVENNDAGENDGGAVLIEDGYFGFYGGFIRVCSARSGGGIFISGGKLEMTGGQITGCSASQNGGGICVVGGEFAMSGGTVGGTVTKDEYATEPLIESDAGNNAQYGGGIHFGSGSHSIGGGIVACNVAQFGGGIAVEPETEALFMSGGILYNNADSGGGVYNRGSVAQAYAEIVNNTAVNGGGIYNEGTYYMQQGAVSSNKSTKDGAGFYNTGHLEITGGSINYNASDMSGGGAVNFGIFRLSGGSFGYNKAAYPGRGMLCHPDGEMIFADAVFIGGDNDTALVKEAFLTLEGPFTCTTKISRLTPVIVSDGFVLENYAKGITLLTGDESPADYLHLFDVNPDSQGGGWRLSSDGRLAPELPGIWFWITVTAAAALVVVGVIFVVKARKTKNHVRSSRDVH